MWRRWKTRTSLRENCRSRTQGKVENWADFHRKGRREKSKMDSLCTFPRKGVEKGRKLCQAANRTGRSVVFPPARPDLRAALRLCARPRSSQNSLADLLSALLFIPGVDVGVDVLDGLSLLRRIFNKLFHTFNGVHGGGMIPAVEDPADLF